MHERLILVSVFALVVMACSRAPAAGSSGAASNIQRCEEVPEIAAPAEAYRDTPIYVANEMPVEEIRSWAGGRPGFQTLWIERDHHGWITVAFSEHAADRQAELEAELPGVGVVAVEIDWTVAQLDALQQRVSDELMPDLATASSTSVTKGMVEVFVGALTPDRIEAVAARFAGERVCVTGVDPGEVISEGPPKEAGDGWRLLADEQRIGQPYRTGIATDQDQYVELWQAIGLPGDPPAVDFESDVVIWFGAVFGSSCPGLRLEDVVVDRVRSMVHGEIVLRGIPAACTADAVPHAFVVALTRSRLPAPPFGIQLGAEDPPGGAQEERTIVDADLRPAGVVATPDQIHGDPRLPEPWVVEAGAMIEPNFEVPVRLNVRCGVEWLGRLNDVAWRTEVPPGSVDYIPPEWQGLVAEQSIVVSVLLRTGAPLTITASANGHALDYRPSPQEPPACD